MGTGAALLSFGGPMAVGGFLLRRHSRSSSCDVVSYNDAYSALISARLRVLCQRGMTWFMT